MNRARTEGVLVRTVVFVLLAPLWAGSLMLVVHNRLQQGRPLPTTSALLSLLGALLAMGLLVLLNGRGGRTFQRGLRALSRARRHAAELQREEDEQRFLARAGELLSATSLDYESTLERVTELAVQRFADWCLVYLVEGEQVRLAEVAHHDPGKAVLAARMRGLFLDARQPYLSRSVIDERRPLLIARVPSAELAAVAQSSEHLEILRDLAPYSYVGVPLIANGRVIGALVFICSESRRIFGPKHLIFAEQLGRLASLALDNAWLYRTARRAAHARDEVLGIVAHDLRNPLSTLTLTLQWLQRQETRSAPSSESDPDPEGGYRRRLALLASAAAAMERLIEDMLDVSRLEAGQTLSMRTRDWSAEALLQEAAETARLQAGQIHLVLDSTRDLPWVEGDRDRLLQVFSNLVGNALKFTPAGGQVRLGARVEGGQVEFFVADTGPGMSAEERAHLFERFWQANRHDRRGAGLGLSIVKGLVEAHGGRLRVESEPGRGTTVFFSVPVAFTDAGTARSST